MVDIDPVTNEASMSLEEFLLAPARAISTVFACGDLTVIDALDRKIYLGYNPQLSPLAVDDSDLEA